MSVGKLELLLHLFNGVDLFDLHTLCDAIVERAVNFLRAVTFLDLLDLLKLFDLLGMCRDERSNFIATLVLRLLS